MESVDYVRFCSNCGNTESDGFTTENDEFFFCCHECGNEKIAYERILGDVMFRKVGTLFGKAVFVKCNGSIYRDDKIEYEGISADVMFPKVGMLFGKDIFTHSNGSRFS